MLNLPSTFAFSQSSLQAFENCPRRFWLAYVERLPWPAVEAAPVQEHETLMRLGSTFHRLVERAEIGIEPERLEFRLVDPLDQWFRAYLDHRPADLPADFIETERVLTIPFGNEEQQFRLAAKYDLITADALSAEAQDSDSSGDTGRVVIVDWKTTRRRADPANLARRLQSQVYPFVLVEASKNLPFGPIRPEQVEMIYWFTSAPMQPIRFRYDAAQHERNRSRLLAIFDRIVTGNEEDDFPKVADTEANRRHVCGYCVYRSRCNRGVTASDVEILEDIDEVFAIDLETALEFTLDDVEELAF